MDRKKCTGLKERNLNLPLNIQVTSNLKTEKNVHEQNKKWHALGKENIVQRNLNSHTRRGSFDIQIIENIGKVRRHQSLDESGSAKRDVKTKQIAPLQSIKTPDSNYYNGSSGSYCVESTPESEVRKHYRSASLGSISSQRENSILLSCSSVNSNAPLSGISSKCCKNETLSQVEECAPRTNDCSSSVHEGTAEDDVMLLPYGRTEVFITPYISDVYTRAIIQYLLQTEKKYTLSLDYPKVYNLTAHKRAILVDWLIEVQHYLRLNEEVLFLTVRLMDKFLDTCHISMKEAQLASVACIWIMSKYDAVMSIVPYADTLLRLCKNQYSMHQLILMERLVIKKCKFNFNVGQPVDFLHFFLKVMNAYQKEIFYTCVYLLNIILVNDLYVSTRPSHLAAASVCATFTLRQELAKQERFLRYVNEFCCPLEVQETKMAMLHGLYIVQNEKTEFVGVFKKYNSSRYNMLSSRIKKKMSSVLHSVLNVKF